MATVQSVDINPNTKNQPNSQHVVTNTTSGMDDGGNSSSKYNASISKSQVNTILGGDDSFFSDVYHANGLYKRNEIDYFNQRYRFGILNPYGVITTCREYLFFTKPDLNIYPRNDSTGIPSKELSDYLQTQPYWLELASKHFDVITCLQQSLEKLTGRNDPFNQLLANTCTSNLDIPSLQSEMIDTPQNMYGVNYQYRGSSESSNDNFDFSLSFSDTKELPVYHFFKAYEEYQTLKHHGVLPPWAHYIMDKVLYDHYSIYKFLVDEDGETIIYWAKMYGVKSKSLPRDTFSSTDFNDGINFSVDFNSAFFDDMNPMILKEFNNISRAYYNAQPYQIDIHNHIFDRTDNRPARAAYIEETDKPSQVYGYKTYKLKWRGDAKG